MQTRIIVSIIIKIVDSLLFASGLVLLAALLAPKPDSGLGRIVSNAIANGESLGSVFILIILMGILIFGLQQAIDFSLKPPLENEPIKKPDQTESDGMTYEQAMAIVANKGYRVLFPYLSLSPTENKLNLDQSTQDAMREIYMAGGTIVDKQGLLVGQYQPVSMPQEEWRKRRAAFRLISDNDTKSNPTEQS